MSVPSDTLLDTLKALPSTDPKEAIYVLGLLVVMVVVVWIVKPRTAKDGHRTD